MHGRSITQNKGASLHRVPGKTSLRVTFEHSLEVSMFLVTRSPIFFSNPIAQAVSPIAL